MIALLKQKINSPYTSSMGRFFDAVASLLNIRQEVTFEGQAAMQLEFLAMENNSQKTYPFEVIRENEKQVIDWREMINSIADDLENKIPLSEISRKFHNTLVEMIITIAKEIGEKRIVLTGGCFQNKLLTELALRKLSVSGFDVFSHSKVPPNDGGIAVGQMYASVLLQGRNH